MNDDLKEQLLELCSEPPNATSPWPHRVIYYALARITDLEARLAAAEKQRRESDEKLTNQRHEINWLKEQQQALKDSLSAAEAGEDALAEALRSYRADLCEGFCLEAEWSDEAHNHPAMQRDCGGCLAAAALAAYGARRGASP